MLLQKVIVSTKKRNKLYVDINNVNTDYRSDKMLQTKDKSKKRFFEGNILGGAKIFTFFFSTFLGNILSRRQVHIFLPSYQPHMTNCLQFGHRNHFAGKNPSYLKKMPFLKQPETSFSNLNRLKSIIFYCKISW
jgi:hypothetical protein